MAEVNSNGMHGIRKRYVDLDLSDNAVDLIMNSWSEGTQKQYSPHINKWFLYCQKHKIDPFASSVNHGAEFLTNYFHEGVGYSSVNTARSALSSIFPTVNGISFGKHPLIVRLLKGMFKQRPALPRYTVTYDVAKVFKYIKDSYPNMSLECLTKNLATLMCLLSGQRSQTMSVLNTKFMYIDDCQCIFYIASLLKTSRPGFHQQPLEFLKYSDQNLCIINYINKYLALTKDLRHNDGGFFISYVPPHKTVTSGTIAKWVVDVLEKAGINISVFSAHSTRSAASSKACQKGLNLTEISKAAGWTNAKTFATYYHKTIKENFGQTLLANH